MYVVEYIHAGTRLRDETIDTPADIKARFAAEGKTVLSIKRKYLVAKVRMDEVLAFLTAMGDLAESGVHTTKALDCIISSFDAKSPFPPILRKIREAVANGMPLATAMATYQHVFGRTVIAMVLAGEASGRMSETFHTSADYVLAQDEIKKELWKKLAYPIVTATIGIISLAINSMFVIPKLMKTELFKLANVNAAAKGQGHDMASMCIDAMRYMSVIVPATLGAIVFIICSAIVLYRYQQEAVEKRIVLIPGVREFVFYRAYFVAFSALAKLVEVGVKLDEALEIVQKSTSFIIIKKQFKAACGYIREGQSFAKGLTTLTPVNRTRLETAQDITRIHKTFAMIGKSYHRMYLDKLRSVSPKIQAGVMILVLAIFVLEFLGIMLPYAKVLNNIR